MNLPRHLLSFALATSACTSSAVRPGDAGSGSDADADGGAVALLVLAPLGASGNGEAHVLFGNPQWTARQTPVLVGAGAGNLHLYAGPGWEVGYGGGVAGDLDRDGYDDIVLSAPGYPVPGSGQPASKIGAAFVFRGRSAWTTTIYNQGNGNFTPEITISSQTRPSSGLGISAKLAGDVNGDGQPDVVAGEEAGVPMLALGPSWTQLALSSTPRSEAWGRWTTYAGDVNADDFDDVIFSSPVLPGARVSLGAPQPSATGVLALDAPACTQPCGSPVGAAGDFDDEGIWDVVVASGNTAWVLRGSRAFAPGAAAIPLAQYPGAIPIQLPQRVISVGGF